MDNNKKCLREEVRILIKYMFSIGDPEVIRGQLRDVSELVRMARLGHKVQPPASWSDNQLGLWGALRTFHGF